MLFEFYRRFLDGVRVGINYYVFVIDGKREVWRSFSSDLFWSCVVSKLSWGVDLRLGILFFVVFNCFFCESCY